MPGTKSVRPYRWLALYYDRVFSFAKEWGKSPRERVLGPILPRIQSACDLACGTGTTAIMLAGRGIKMYGVDLSPAMCRMAREKVKRARMEIPIIRADMRSFRLPERVDLVLCEFDALNHVPKKVDLPRVAKAVSRALRPGGYFYFDVNNRPAFEKIWPLTNYIEKPGVVVVMHGGCDPSGERAWSDVEWFIREGGCWRRRHEHVEEVCWTASEMRDALHDAGFNRIRPWDAAALLKLDPMIRPGYRTFYLARKAEA